MMCLSARDEKEKKIVDETRTLIGRNFIARNDILVVRILWIG